MLKPGDKVIMNGNYYVGEADKGKVWVVLSEPWELCGMEVVLLEGKCGSYATDGLTVVN